MSLKARQEYLKVARLRYQKASRRLKTRILDELCAQCGYHRDYAIRILNQKQATRLKLLKGRPSIYPQSLSPHIKTLWRMMNRICHSRMKAALPVWIHFYQNDEQGVLLTESERELLLKMSSASLGRFIKKLRAETRGLSTTNADGFLKNQIPLQSLDFKITKPGFMQIDTVAHCGDNLSGSYAYTLTATDIYSNWTENRAVFTKQSKTIVTAMENIEDTIPFCLHTVGSDNGTEFLNYRMQRYLQNRSKPIHFTRSRPYKKNDQCYVEQKNYTHVRQLFGYERMEQEHLINKMNKIYEEYWNPLHNFFYPSTKLIEKKRVGSKVIKRYDHPKTPYQRIMENEFVQEHQKQNLQNRYKKLNPIQLTADLEKELKELFRLWRPLSATAKAA